MFLRSTQSLSHTQLNELSRSNIQGRLPIRVTLKGLSEEDLYRILTEPVTNLIRQQIEMLKVREIKREEERKEGKNVGREEEVRKVAKEGREKERNDGGKRKEGRKGEGSEGSNKEGR